MQKTINQNKIMKIKTIQQVCLALALGLVLFLPVATRAGGSGQVAARFTPMKTADEINAIKPGDTIVKVCRDCGAVTLVRVVKGGKGVYDYVAKKCEECGSENTYLAVSKQPVPFKDQMKP
jgi:hypothetical protein